MLALRGTALAEPLGVGLDARNVPRQRGDIVGEREREMPRLPEYRMVRRELERLAGLQRGRIWSPHPERGTITVSK